MIVILFGQNRSNIKTMTNSWLHGELCKTGTVDSWWLCAGIVVLLLQIVGEVEENFQLPNCIALWRSRYKIISSSWPPWCSSSCPKCSHPLPFLLSAVSFLRLRKATIRHCLGLYCSKLCA